MLPCTGNFRLPVSSMTSLLGNMGADWLLKRAFKFLLKKNLGSILQNEVRKAWASRPNSAQQSDTPVLSLPLTCLRIMPCCAAPHHPTDALEHHAWQNRARRQSSQQHWVSSGHLTSLQVDLDMLNVSLGTGTLEIHSALLNTDYLDAQLVSAATPLQRALQPCRCCTHCL